MFGTIRDDDDGLSHRTGIETEKVSNKVLFVFVVLGAGCDLGRRAS